MAVELAEAYVSIIPSARGIEQKIATELAPVTGIAGKQGEVAGAALGGSFVQKFAGKTGNLLQGLDRQLGSFGGPFTGNLTTIGTSLRAVESGQLRVASGASDLERVATGAYVGIGLAAAGFGAVSIKSALGGEQAQAQLEQAFKATGNEISDYGSQLDGARKKLAGFGFDNEQVNASLASLVRVTKDPAKSIGLVALAADTARARNEDLATSTQRLVNVEAGRIRGLTQLGISTKDANGKTITSEEAIKRITALYGGAAAANAKTYEGELQALGATAHNLEEEVGGALLPVVANLGNELVSGVHGLEAINSATHGWLGSLAGAAFVGGAAFVAVTKISSGVGKLVDLFKSQALVTDTLTTAEATNATAAEADAVAQGELAGASGTAGAAMDSEAASAGILSTQLGGLATGLAGVAAGFFLGKKAGDEINNLVTGATPKVDELTASLLKLEQGQKGAFDFSGIGNDLKGQISTPDSPLGLPAAFGQSISDVFSGGEAHRAKAEIGPINDALKSILQTEGVDKATAAYGELLKGFEAQGVSVRTLAGDFAPFQSALDLAGAKEQDVKGTTDSLSSSFDDLAKGFAKQTAKLGIADQLDSAKQAVDDLNQLKLDAAGEGDKSKQAAQQEASAQQSLTDAYRSQQTAATSLADAKSKLAQFDSPTDTRIRSLELQNIQGRVVTTPEEARQKEIDLLQFSEDNANKRADLQAQVASAENGVTSATEGVSKAIQGVADAAQNRRKIQTDAAAAIEGAERKATEAVDAAGTAINNAKIAGQLGKGNTQLNIYVGLLDALAQRVDPNSPLTKGLDQFLTKASTAAFITKLRFVPGYGSTTQPEGPIAPTAVAPGYGSTTTPEGPKAPNTNPVVINQENHFHGNDKPSIGELDTLNKKQAIRLRVGAR